MPQHTLCKRGHVRRQPARKTRHRDRGSRCSGQLQQRDLVEVDVGVGCGGEDGGGGAVGGEGGDVGDVGREFGFL